MAFMAFTSAARPSLLAQLSQFEAIGAEDNILRELRCARRRTHVCGAMQSLSALRSEAIGPTLLSPQSKSLILEPQYAGLLLAIETKFPPGSKAQVRRRASCRLASESTRQLWSRPALNPVRMLYRQQRPNPS